MSSLPPPSAAQPNGCDLFGRPGRVILVSPCPDEEVLRLGGGLAMLGRSGREVLVVAVSDGDDGAPNAGAEPGDETSLGEVADPSRVSTSTPLHPNAQLVRLGLKDGQIVRYEQWLTDLLGYLSEDAAVMFVPGCRDGHRDDEACSRAAKAAADGRGVPWCEYRLWGEPAEEAGPAREMPSDSAQALFKWAGHFDESPSATKAGGRGAMTPAGLAGRGAVQAREAAR